MALTRTESRRQVAAAILAVSFLLTICAAIVFALPQLSVVVRSAVLFLVALTFLTIARVVEWPLSTAVDGLAAVVYLVAVHLAFVGRGSGQPIDVLLLLVIVPTLLLGVVLLVDWSAAIVERRHVAVLLASFLLIGVALVGVDVSGPHVTYETTFENRSTVETSLSSPSADPVGRILASNEFVFPRTLDPPTYEACVAGPGTDVVEHVTLVYHSRAPLPGHYIDGETDRTITVWAEYEIPDDASEDVVMTVERGADCPAERDEPTLIVYRTGG